ncbi:MAG: dephospho-CoA kinase [Methylacidiphilales bacterium]|nr:dephospho-CoA kinase [Candidatus Methylacidiphilales bacterium]MDW8349834.1 dephospho-CoA kinase [Verrucomicrobiae bacterium]
MKKRIWGLTGGIACGKSTAAEMLKKMGWKILDADTIAHELMAPGQINWKLIVDNFGTSILKDNLEINRSALAEKVFAHPEELQLLNKLTHPNICANLLTQIEHHRAHQASTPLLVVVPLLYEIDFVAPFDAILVVAASLAIQKHRLIQRGLTESAIQARLKAQWPLQEKITRADCVIWNDGSLETLHMQINVFQSQI